MDEASTTVRPCVACRNCSSLSGSAWADAKKMAAHGYAGVVAYTRGKGRSTDAIVPFEVSGKRSAAAIAGARLVVLEDAPHGLNASHAAEFNAALLEFLRA